MKSFPNLLVFLASLLLCAPFFVKAQQAKDSVLGAEVKAERVRTVSSKASFLPGLKQRHFDSSILQQYQQQSVANLLSEAASVFVKSYGVNSLATLMFRGASAAQSVVCWQGVPLNNVGTGLADISILPVLFADSLSLQYGGTGAMGGSGNVGGALLLNSKQAQFSTANHWSGRVQLGLGSFQTQHAGLAIAWHNRRFDIRVRAVGQLAKNDFEQQLADGSTYVASNAASRGGGWMTDAFYKINSRQIISAHVWLQEYQREIPRALFEPSSVKSQTDASSRVLLAWNRTGQRVNSYAKLAFMEDRFAYQDPSIHLSNAIQSRQLYAEAGGSGNIGQKTQWLLFAPVQVMGIKDKEASQQARVALAGSLLRTFFRDRLSLALNGRAEHFGADIIFLPGVSAAFHLDHDLKLTGSIQKSYRAPNLNELYYQPGGNAGLKPEQGWSAELGYSWNKAIKRNLLIYHSLNGYTRLVDDWIIWMGGAVWTPHNLASVWSRGLETENRLLGRMGAWHWEFGLSLAYSRATPTKSYLVNDNSIGCQLPYTPAFTGNLNASVRLKNYSIRLLNTFVGERFITSDESAVLPTYNIGTLHLGYALQKFIPKLNFDLSIQNLWNTHYEVVAYRPMPGLHFLLGLGLNLN
ncbi:MAG: TonB-dependent receptor [Bacteroidetes bacterium]|nr:TonB-dependent receptor [Bacteroidota bacterium]